MPVDVFIAYARKDSKLRDELGKQLSALKRQNIINDWFDGEVIEGTEWKEQLLAHLRTAQVILLLISPDFVASHFCYDVEMQEAMKRHEAREARVIPVLLRPVDWKKLPFGKIQAAPKDGKPVILWEQRDEALFDIVMRVKRSIYDLQKGGVVVEEQEATPGHSGQKALPDSGQAVPPSSTTYRVDIVSGPQAMVNLGEHVTSSVFYLNDAKKASNHEDLLAIMADLVDRTNELCDRYGASQTEASSEEAPQLDPGYLKWFIDVMWDIKQQTIPIPAALLARVQAVCQRLHLPCFLQ